MPDDGINIKNIKEFLEAILPTASFFGKKKIWRQKTNEKERREGGKKY